LGLIGLISDLNACQTGIYLSTYSAYSFIQINAVPVVTYIGGISGTAHNLNKVAEDTG